MRFDDQGFELAPSYSRLRHSGESRNPSLAMQSGSMKCPVTRFAMDPDFRRGDGEGAELKRATEIPESEVRP